MPSVIDLTFIVGLGLVILAIIGGGLEIKEIKIPPLPMIPRVLSGIVGCALVALRLFDPNIFQDGGPAPPKERPASSTRAASVLQPVLLAYSENQKDFARKLGNYLGNNGYDVNATLDDFSGIKVESRERQGTIRIVYKSVAKDAELKLVSLIRSQFTSDMGRLVESQNNSASVDLQIQLW
jgi:hypothetical protein